jgi:molecular chaperone DnaJ
VGAGAGAAGAGPGGAGDPFGGAGSPFGGDVGDIFEQFFGGAGQSRERQRGGSDLRTSLTIDLAEAYRGVTKEVVVTRPERCPECGGAGHPADADSRRCPTCDGTGQETTVQQTPLGRVQQTRTCRRCSGRGEVYSESCPECGGEGRVRREARLEVEVPAGIRDDQTLRMEGEGAPAPGGGRDGDLLIEVSVRDHPEFDRDGDDLYHRTGVSFPQAVFGDTIEVATLDGTSEFDLPAGTQSGETFRLQGKGMPRLQRRGRGDLYVQVQVVTPEDLNEEQREALEAFAEAGGEEIEVEQGFFERIRNSL